MPKPRIHELAKQYNVNTKDLIDKLKEIGIDGKTAASTLEDDVIAKMNAEFSRKKDEKSDKSKNSDSDESKLVKSDESKLVKSDESKLIKSDELKSAKEKKSIKLSESETEQVPIKETGSESKKKEEPLGAQASKLKSPINNESKSKSESNEQKVDLFLSGKNQPLSALASGIFKNEQVRSIFAAGQSGTNKNSQKDKKQITKKPQFDNKVPVFDSTVQQSVRTAKQNPGIKTGVNKHLVFPSGSNGINAAQPAERKEVKSREQQIKTTGRSTFGSAVVDGRVKSPNEKNDSVQAVLGNASEAIARPAHESVETTERPRQQEIVSEANSIRQSSDADQSTNISSAYDADKPQTQGAAANDSNTQRTASTDQRRPDAHSSQMSNDRPRTQDDRARQPYQGNSQRSGNQPYQGNSQRSGNQPYQGNSQRSGNQPYQGNSQRSGNQPYQGNSQRSGNQPYQGNSQRSGNQPYQGNSQRSGNQPYQGNSQQSGNQPYSQNRPQSRPMGNAPGGFNKDVNDKTRTDRPARSFGTNTAPRQARPQQALVNNTGKPEKRNFTKPAASKQGAYKQGGKPAFDTDGIAAARSKQGGRQDVRSISKSDKARLIAKQQAEKLKIETQRALKLAEEEQARLQALEDEIIIKLPKLISVRALAERIKQSSVDVIKKLMKKGIMASLGQEIDYNISSQIVEEYNLIPQFNTDADVLEDVFKEEEEDDSAELVERPPIVVVMGHVDHGKTSLLDAIRHTNVIQTEAGGITQHIGAYTVKIKDKPITFLDTPGHEAFTAMRMRGASITDIAILVVSAVDGVMPQTIEAINHAKAANIDIIVAINQIDKPNINMDRVKQELADSGLLIESWGGNVICAEVSALKRIGIDHLLEMILLSAEMKELKANPNKKARGVVIEAMLDKGRGPVATVLVQKGTLNVGDPVVIGSSYGKIRAMSDDKGVAVSSATPSIPVEILGLSEVPKAGDSIYVANSEKHARVSAEAVIAKRREELSKDVKQKISLGDLFTQIKTGTVKELYLVVKGDVQGSVEALKNSFERLSTEEVVIKTIHGGVGAINESDVMLAAASNAIIIGFNVKLEPTAKSVADREKVDVRLYRIIYNALEDMQAAMKGMLDPIFEEKIIGHAEIRQIFKSSSVGTIAGSYVTDGKFTRNAKIRIFRDKKTVYTGSLESLKRFKDEVKEVNSGYECGLLFTKFNDIVEHDIVEAYVMEEVAR